MLVVMQGGSAGGTVQVLPGYTKRKGTAPRIASIFEEPDIVNSFATVSRNKKLIENGDQNHASLL